MEELKEPGVAVQDGLWRATWQAGLVGLSMGVDSPGGWPTSAARTAAPRLCDLVQAWQGWALQPRTADLASLQEMWGQQFATKVRGHQRPHLIPS